MARQKKADGIRLKGFFRVQLVNKKTGRVEGDTGYKKNVITNFGFESCIAALPFKGVTDSAQGSFMILGSGTVPATDAAGLDGSDTDQVSSFAGISVVDSLTQRVSQEFEGSDHSMTTLANIGILVATSGPLVCGNTFDSSELGAEQQVNCTYELRFSRV